MEQKKTRMYLNHLSNEEKERMTNELPFLRHNDEKSKKRLMRICNKLYAKENKLERIMDNGYTSQGSYASGYYVIIGFEQKMLSDKAISVLGSCDEWDWRYFYGIAIGREDRQVYVISFSNACSPNWNDEYNRHKTIPLDDIDFSILKDDGVVYRMDDALHSAINNEIYSTAIIFSQTEGCVMMVVKDQHGNYCEIKGTSLENVFRDYADHYTGYRDYRHQMASEWEIVSSIAKEEYEEWKRTAKGLKSDFDKFYRGGIVD